MLGAAARRRGLDGRNSQLGSLRSAALVAAGVVVGVAASDVFLYAVSAPQFSGGFQLFYFAPVVVGVSIVFSTCLVLAAWAYWISRREAIEAERDLKDVDQLVATGLARAGRIAAIGRTLRDADGVAPTRDP